MRKGTASRSSRSSCNRGRRSRSLAGYSAALSAGLLLLGLAAALLLVGLDLGLDAQNLSFHILESGHVHYSVDAWVVCAFNIFLALPLLLR